MAEVSQKSTGKGPDRGLASSKMAELAVSPAGPGLRRYKTLNALRYKIQMALWVS
jgi:hypothetical protein